jgi:iron complex outermembrane recepter protein
MKNLSGKSNLFATVAAIALISASTAFAQDAAQKSQGPTSAVSPAAPVETVVVTGTRLRVTGYDAPTPTTIISAENIVSSAQPNVFNAITQLPSLQGSTGATVGTNNTSTGQNGLSSFNLRGLGPIRTLTLLDGQRVVPANVTGVPDISLYPQILIKRVDIVTGGASASYGSDAVAGVINIITDTKFMGLKGNLLGSVTDYGDNQSVSAQLAWGTRLADDKLHLVLSGEYTHEDGVPANGFGAGPGPNGRTWYQAPSLQVRTIANTPAGSPQITRILNGQDYQFALYGLITSGPLQGTAFGDNGVPYTFRYGSNGVPTRTGGVTNCVAPFCEGGDLAGNVGNGTSLASKLDRYNGYSRVSYDLDDRNEVFATLNVSRVSSSSTPNPGAFRNANLTIQCENPFVPASVQTACATNAITSFQFGTSNAQLPKFISVLPVREQVRFVVGMNGAIDFLGNEWKYNGYAQLGRNLTKLDVEDILLIPRYLASIDAVRDASGTIVCRSLAARSSGCVPMNVLGNVAPSAATLAYITPENGPRQRSDQREFAFGFGVSGEPFSLWAGPVAVATGLEYRKESYSVKGDPYGDGTAPENPYTTDYPADPLLNVTNGNNWYAGNFHRGKGEYDVAEAYVEFGVPLFDTDGAGKAALNLAGRATNYSTSGFVATYKIGGTWKTPIEGLRLRAVNSKDVRAPNLSELYAAPTIVNITVNDPVTRTAVTAQSRTIGNPALTPEIGRTTEFGVVYTNPSWFPGFSVSADYYTINIDKLISTITPQQTVDLCFAGNTALCSNVFLTGGGSTTPNFVIVQAINLAEIKTRGLDLEASYQFELPNVPGKFALRGLATRTFSFETKTGVLGQDPIQSAGNNSGSVPYWKFLATQTWDTDKFSLNLTERWFSDGVINRMFIECQTDCPAPTFNRPTINNNQIKGAFYLDLGGTWNVNDDVKLYFKVDNLLNRDPEPDYKAVPNNFGANPLLYDIFGRTYRAGVRFKF